MYSSLHKVDIVVADQGRGGGELLVQTDHRDASEVDGEVELAVLFALARIIVPLRVERWKGATVRYVALGQLHPALAEVVAATGQLAESMGQPFDVSGVRARPAADLAEEAFERLSAKVLAREGIEATEDGLAELEGRVAAGGYDAEADEIGYWTAVAELAAVTGSVLRARHGGRWVDDPKDFADIPFMFGVGSSLVNPVGKAIKFIAHGERDSPRQLLRSMEDQGTPDGPLLVNMKPAHWDGRGYAICEPLAPDLEKTGAPIPLVAYGYDHPNTFAMKTKDGGANEDLASLRRQAIENLAAVEVQVERVALDAITFWVAHSSFFAAEKILDPTFMQGLHRTIGAPLLAAAVPEKGRLFVTSAVASPETMHAFMALARGAYERNEGGRQLSPTVFLIMEGRITGVAQATAGEPEPKKKGFFSRLFN
jgi:hypothetical protein